MHPFLSSWNESNFSLTSRKIAQKNLLNYLENFWIVTIRFDQRIVICTTNQCTTSVQSSGISGGGFLSIPNPNPNAQLWQKAADVLIKIKYCNTPIGHHEMQLRAHTRRRVISDRSIKAGVRHTLGFFYGKLCNKKFVYRKPTWIFLTLWAYLLEKKVKSINFKQNSPINFFSIMAHFFFKFSITMQ